MRGGSKRLAEQALSLGSNSFPQQNSEPYTRQCVATKLLGSPNRACSQLHTHNRQEVKDSRKNEFRQNSYPAFRCPFRQWKKIITRLCDYLLNHSKTEHKHRLFPFKLSPTPLKRRQKELNEPAFTGFYYQPMELRILLTSNRCCSQQKNAKNNYPDLNGCNASRHEPVSIIIPNEMVNVRTRSLITKINEYFRDYRAASELSNVKTRPLFL